MLEVGSLRAEYLENPLGVDAASPRLGWKVYSSGTNVMQTAYHVQASGTMGSIQGFVQTLAMALAGSIAAWALHVVGYVPGVEQSSGTIFGLKLLMGVLPAFVLLFTASILWFDISEEKQKQITKELAERRQQNS